MAVLSYVRSRLAVAARWLGPSIAAACAGALVTGVIEGLGADSALGAIATAGFAAVLVVPALVIAIALVRGMWAAWEPDELALALVEDGGGAPRLAGWLAFAIIAMAALGWTMFEATWLLGAWTQFKPLPVAFAEPGVAIGALVMLAIVSRPLVRVLSALARSLDARWRRRWPERRSLLLPRRIFAVIGTAIAAATYAIWRFLIKSRIGPLDLDVFLAPALGGIVALAATLAWRRLGLRARQATGAGLAVVVFGAIGVATFTWRARPSLTLEIWGDRPLAGFAIDHLLDLDNIRSGVSLAEFQPTPKPGAAHPDIILITIDTVRADHTPPYGGTANMPALRELASRGVVFDWALSPSNVTRRSIPSMVIGLAPNRVHGRVVGWALRVDPRHVLLAERLLAGGYDTAGFMCCKGFWGSDAHTGLARGLDYIDIEDQVDEVPDGKKLAARARTWLAAREARHPDRPLFVWMHILEPHNWTQGQPDPKSDEDRRKIYDRSLAESDAMLAQVLGAFANRTPDRAPIVIVTADHGEGLGEHGHPYHSTDLYDSQTHVPLVIAGAGIPQHRVAETVSLTDLVPTILDLAGFVPPHGASIDGHSMADLATGKRTGTADEGVAFAAMIKDRSNPGGVTALTRGRWKLIDSGGVDELYDVRVDPDEKYSLASEKGNVLEELRKLLKAKVAAGDSSPF